MKPEMALDCWIPDTDRMNLCDSFIRNPEMSPEPIPIFIEVLFTEDDPRYVKLKLTKEWKKCKIRFKDCTYLCHSYLFPDSQIDRSGQIFQEASKDTKLTWTYDAHGPVRKLESFGFSPCKYEQDNTEVFKFPQAWPEHAMEWLVRPRTGPWPSPELVQEIFESGCHIAPVGRGKRVQDPIGLPEYLRNPSKAEVSTSKYSPNSPTMDETEWRLSFSVAENKLGESVTPVQRHIMILLKMIKKFYFPDVGISTYLLKNLLFWEIEKQNESFWKEDKSVNCLVHMLDRLQQCLEKECLPHYILPGSNLLADEDPCKLAEAARLISDVRKTILPKSISMLQRSVSMTYQSPELHKIFHRSTESLLGKLEDKCLPDCEVQQLVRSLLLLSAKSCQGCIEHLFKVLVKNSDKAFRKDQRKQMSVRITLNTYESLLARCLSKLWLLPNSTDISKENFTSYVRKESANFSPKNDFVQLALEFFHQAQQGNDCGNLVPKTSAMQSTKEILKLLAEKEYQESVEVLNCGLTTSDFEKAGVILTERMKNVEITPDPEEMEKELMKILMEISCSDENC